ncbi:MAG: HpaII family restriction endonuclease [Oscillospiraceae bacterium]|nr:HpaII family restriction endonuclease [Oscillospiraceae bacterium]MCL2278596.1 HpaII family restriction endonuclease [Oscillospiraceae bacterium]
MGKLKSIDLFAGIGGIRLGFEKAFGDEVQTVFVSEIDDNAQKTYKSNFDDDFEIKGDITKIAETDIPTFDICLAGFPCQAFSLAGQRKGFEDDYKGSSRGTLFFDVVRICAYHKPKVILCENVKGLAIHDKGRTYEIIKGALEEIGYTVHEKVLNSRDFGVPQNRERIYIVAFRNDIDSSDFEFPNPKDSNKRLEDIIEDKAVSAKYYLSETYVETLVKHKARHESKGNGFGYEIREWSGVAGAIVCGGMGRERNLLIDKRQTDLTPVTHIKGKINNKGIRKMTPREWARLQGYDDEYKLPLADVHLYKQLGNSVTVPVIEEIAKQIKDTLSRADKLMGSEGEDEIMQITGNKGEWSELYAFIKLLKDGRIYAADENVNKLDDIFLPIIKIIREETKGEIYDYHTGESIRIYKDNELINTISISELKAQAEFLFTKIFEGSKTKGKSGSFPIDELEEFIGKIHIKKIKAPYNDKVDMLMQIHDINTGFSPEVGFSVKSDVGSPPTLLNSGKNTRIKYKVHGINDEQMEEINAIDKTVLREYMIARMVRLFSLCSKIEYHCVKDETFTDNLILIDSLLPELFGEMVLRHYSNIDKGIYDCEELIRLVEELNPLDYRASKIYRYKIKRLICASALGMTPGKTWDGLEAATGGYIIVKRDGDVLCYHIYNRNFFEEYLMRNTQFDRPSASKFDYGYLYKENGAMYLDLNVQIRFKNIK